MTTDPLTEKIRFFDEMTDEILRSRKATAERPLDPFVGDIEDFPVGRFASVETLQLRWVSEGWFEYLPDEAAPFAFHRSNGEVVTPGHMYTDGGSIPRIFWLKKGLFPWDYGPAYLVHDWEFDLHHDSRTDKSFEEVRDTMMEAVRTLMDGPLAQKREWVFGRIYDGINSGVARKIWDR